MNKNRSKYFFILFLLLTSVAHGSTTARPKIGLVLSGGGAKGFAHIGTLKLLDSLQIPVDYIVGTSMGGIAGALYAIGYNGLEIEQLISRIDWQEIFSDKPPRAELPFFQKKETGKFQLVFGLHGLKPITPSGLIFGQKISLLFSSLTFPYERISNFDHLPIPFRCVAVDLVTGNQVVLKNGSLAKAMRATMSIPSVFSPVEWGDSLLVDGGLVNNLPVDIVREMGADIVIAVDVGAPLLERKKLDSALSVLEQTLNIVGLDCWKENIKKADILISPDIERFTVADFDKNKIKKIIQKGNIAAHQSLPQLMALKEKYRLRRMKNPTKFAFLAEQPRIYGLKVTGQITIPLEFIYKQLNLKPGDIFDPMVLQAHLAELKASGYFESIQYEVIPVSDDLVRLVIRVREKQKPIIYGISIVGNRILPFRFIYRLLGLNPGDQLDTDDLNRRIMEMYGLGYFERIQYDIEPVSENQVYLNLTVKELPLRRLRVGLRYDDLHKLVAAVSIQATNIILPGLRLEDELQFAGLTRLSAKAYYPSRTLNLPVYPFLSLLYKNIPINIFDPQSGDQIASYKDRSATIGMGLGLLFARSFNVEIGYQHEYMNIDPNIALSDPLMFPTWKDKLRQIHIKMNVDVLDDILLPRKGFLIKAQYEGSFQELNSDLRYYLVNVSADLYHTFYRRHTARIYTFWGTGSSLPIYKFTYQGGPNTFVGLEYDQLCASKMSILRFDYRYQHKKDVFLKLIANVAFDLEYHLHPILVRPDNLWGFGVGLKLLSPVGPIEFIFSRGDKNFIGPRAKQNVAYFTLGYKF